MSLKKKLNKGQSDFSFLIGLLIFIGALTFMSLQASDYLVDQTIANTPEFQNTQFNETTSTGTIDLTISTFTSLLSFSSPILWISLMIVIPSLVGIIYIIVKIIRGF